MAEERVLADAEVTERLVGELRHWRLEEGAIRRRYTTKSWRVTLMVVNAIGHLAEAAFHHPDLAVSYGAVEVALATHSAGGLTEKDLALARTIESVVHWRPGAEGGPLTGPPDEERFTYIVYDD